MAGNPYTINTTTELSCDPTYKDRVSWQTKLGHGIIQIFDSVGKWLHSINKGYKILVSIGLLTVAMIIAFKTGGIAGMVAILQNVALGVGFSVSAWGIMTWLTGGGLTQEGLGNVVIDAFLFAFAFAFISSGINAIKYLCRSRAVSTAVLNQQIYPPNNGAVVGTEQTITLQPGTYGRYGTISNQSNYITQSGASASQLSLPPWNDGVYIKIRVLKPIEGVVQSTVAAWAPWNGVGGGIQYMLPQPIDMLKIAGYLIY